MTDRDLARAKLELLAMVDAHLADVSRFRARILGGDPVAEKLAELHTRCNESGIKVEHGCVGEYGASSLTGLAVQTLRNRRCKGELPEFDKGAGGKVFYRLSDLAQYLVDLAE